MMNKDALALSLHQVTNLQMIDKQLREHIRNHIDQYDDDDEDVIRLLAQVAEAISKQITLSSMISS